MKIVVTKDYICFDGERQTYDAGSRGFNSDLLCCLAKALGDYLDIEKVEVNNFIFNPEDKQKSIPQHFSVIANKLSKGGN